MKTQGEILERIRTTQVDDLFGTALLYQFLERAGQVELLGKRLRAQLGDAKAFHEPLTSADVGPMLVQLVSESRDWPHEDQVTKARKQRMRALVWLVDDDRAFDWTKTARELVLDIETAYGVSPE